VPAPLACPFHHLERAQNSIRQWHARRTVTGNTAFTGSISLEPGPGCIQPQRSHNTSNIAGGEPMQGPAITLFILASHGTLPLGWRGMFEPRRQSIPRRSARHRGKSPMMGKSAICGTIGLSWTERQNCRLPVAGCRGSDRAPGRNGVKDYRADQAFHVHPGPGTSWWLRPCQDGIRDSEPRNGFWIRRRTASGGSNEQGG